jgi:hypothetical protein
MSTRDLVACLSVFLGIGSVLLSAITVVPELEADRSTLVVVLVSAAALLGIVAVLLRLLPEEHWCSQPRRFNTAVAVIALIMTLLLVG